MIQFDIAYCLDKLAVGCENGQTLAYEFFVGFRYVDVDGTIEPRGALPGVSGDWDFFDPTLGARVTWDTGNRWSVDFEIDIGGFGAGSDITWHVRTGVRYRIARWLSVEFGYKALDIDYGEGSGATRFEWDTLMHGPYLALNFHFQPREGQTPFTSCRPHDALSS